ncbi:Thiol-disulfide isomerase or thioredoxin (TrxA) [Fructobacillus cardui]|nr:Thiol-disulfide isomerase or thioredoxin (TrxA) [Fructobacillus cardui]
MKTKVKKGRKQHEKGSWRDYFEWKLLLSFVGVCAILVGAFTLEAPQLSAKYQNNRPVQVQQKGAGVFFYNPNCSACKKAYPAVFWHNFWHMTNEKERIEVVNVAYSANQHYIHDYGIVATPTMMTEKGQLQSSDGQKLVSFTERSGKHG